MKRLAPAVLVASLAFSLLALLKSHERPAADFGQLTVQQIDVVDGAGNLRARIGQVGRLDGWGITILDANGNERGRLAVDAFDRTVLVLWSDEHLDDADNMDVMVNPGGPSSMIVDRVRVREDLIRADYSQ